MRLLRTYVGNCHAHPSAPKRGDQGGGIHCEVCEMEIGQWDLPWQPRWARGAENLMARMVSLALPQSVIRWALTRALVHATHPRWGDTIALGAATIPISVVALRWELRVPARRLPFFPEWMRAYMSH